MAQQRYFRDGLLCETAQLRSVHTFKPLKLSVNSASSHYESVVTVINLGQCQTLLFLGPWIWWNWAWKVSEFDVLEEVFWFVVDMNSFCLSFTGARSWPRGLTCALSMWSTQRAGTVSCSASKRTRLRRWRPSRRAAGWNWSARYDIIQNYFFIKYKWKNFQDVQVKIFFCEGSLLVERIWPIQISRHNIYSFLGVSVIWSPKIPSLLSLQPAPPRDAHFVSTKKNVPQLLEPIPYEFMA